jgi:cysteine desulfurase / selenocysteine lyase
MIYFDHASTSIPKSKTAIESIQSYLVNNGASPGRGGHSLAKDSSTTLEQCRSELRSLLGAQEKGEITFTQNATHGLNLILKGLLKPGEHVISTSLEHNSVLRPLNSLRESRQIDWDVLYCDKLGKFDIRALEKLVKSNTKLLVINHVSNVIGSIAPIEDMVATAKKYGFFVLLDISQSLGVIPLKLSEWNIDFAAGTGHKGLRGPQGIGFNYIREPDLISPFIEGGSGQNSISLHQPQFGPEKFEAGTPNMVGIVGLLGAIEEFKKTDRATDSSEKMHLVVETVSALKSLKNINLYWSGDIRSQAPLFSINIQGCLPQNVSFLLERDYGIVTRPGLQCAPLAHKSIGTFPNGTVRVSFGEGNSSDQAKLFVSALKDISKKFYEKTRQRRVAKHLGVVEPSFAPHA